MTKEWINDDHDLFENDGEKTVQKFTVSIEMESPDGITDSRLTRVVSRALTDSNYLYGEVTSTLVSAKLESGKTVSVKSDMADRMIGKKIKVVWHRPN